MVLIHPGSSGLSNNINGNIMNENSSLSKLGSLRKEDKNKIKKIKFLWLH